MVEIFFERLESKRMCWFSTKQLPATLCEPRCWVKTQSLGIKLTIWQKSQGRWCWVWETAAWRRSPSPTPKYLALLTSLTACPPGEHNTWSILMENAFFVHFDPLLGTPRGAKAERGLGPIFKMESKWAINYNYKSMLCEVKNLVSGPNYISIHRVSVSISVRLFYLHRLSQGKLLGVNIYICCSLLQYVSNDVFFRSPYSSASHRRRPLLMFKISQSWSKLQWFDQPCHWC